MPSGIFDWDDEEEKREDGQRTNFQPPVRSVDYWAENERQERSGNDPWQEPAVDGQWEQEPVEYIPYPSDANDASETARRGGLAWSAGIVFFSSIMFMLFIGWGADWIFQSSPWGIVAGIVLGSILGFIQFFRISSQIFNPAKTRSSLQSFMPRDEDDR